MKEDTVDGFHRPIFDLFFVVVFARLRWRALHQLHSNSESRGRHPRIQGRVTGRGNTTNCRFNFGLKRSLSQAAQSQERGWGGDVAKQPRSGPAISVGRVLNLWKD